MSESGLTDGGIEAAQDPLASLTGLIDHLLNDINSVFTRVELQMPFGGPHPPVLPTSPLAMPAGPVCCCTRQAG
jgi:hypothetical protein